MTSSNDRSMLGLTEAVRDVLVGAYDKDARRLNVTAFVDQPLNETDAYEDIRRPFAWPKSHLKPSYVPMSGATTIVPRSVGHDGLLYGTYGSNRRQLVRSDDGFETKELGFDFGEGAVISCTRTASGYAAIVRQAGPGSPGSAWFSTDFATGWTKVQDFSPETSVDRIGIHWYHGDRQQIGLVWEYSTPSPGQVHKLWLTRDGGQTWQTILETPVVDPDTNSHGHHAVFDPFAGRIYASNGDGDNARFSFSDDFGSTWTHIGPGDFDDPDGIAAIGSLGDLYQPTLLIPCEDRIIITPDRTLPPVVLSLRKDLRFLTQKAAGGGERFTLRHELSVWDGADTGQFFAVQPYAQRDDEIYFVYPSNRTPRRAFVVASGDGGRSWHTVWGAVHTGTGAQMNEGIVGPDANGNIVAYVVDDGQPYLWRAKTLEWVYR